MFWHFLSSPGNSPCILTHPCLIQEVIMYKAATLSHYWQLTAPTNEPVVFIHVLTPLSTQGKLTALSQNKVKEFCSVLEEEKYREDIKITFKGMTSKMRMPCVFSKKKGTTWKRWIFLAKRDRGDKEKKSEAWEVGDSCSKISCKVTLKPRVTFSRNRVKNLRKFIHETAVTLVSICVILLISCHHQRHPRNPSGN